MNFFKDHLNLSNNIYDNAKILKAAEIKNQQEVVDRNPTTKYYQTLAQNLQEQINHLTETYNNKLLNERREPGVLTWAAAQAERLAARGGELAGQAENAIGRVIKGAGEAGEAAAAREAAAAAARASARLREFVIHGAEHTHPDGLGKWILDLSPEALAIYRELYGTTGVAAGYIPLMGVRPMRIKYIPGGNHSIEYWNDSFGHWSSMKGTSQMTPFGPIGSNGRLITRSQIPSNTPISSIEASLGTSSRGSVSGAGVGGAGVGGGLGQQTGAPGY